MKHPLLRIAVLLLCCACWIAAAVEASIEVGAAAESWAGQYSWSVKGGEKGGQKGPVACTLTRAADGKCSIAWTSKYQGKDYAYAGDIAPSADNAKLLVGVATQTGKGKKKGSYHIMVAFTPGGELRGKAFLGKNKDGSFKDQVAIFTLKKK